MFAEVAGASRPRSRNSRARAVKRRQTYAFAFKESQLQVGDNGPQTGTDALGAGGRGKAPDTHHVEPRAFQKLCNIAHSESAVDKWTNSASGFAAFKGTHLETVILADQVDCHRPKRDVAQARDRPAQQWSVRRASAARASGNEVTVVEPPALSVAMLTTPAKSGPSDKKGRRQRN